MASYTSTITDFKFYSSKPKMKKERLDWNYSSATTATPDDFDIGLGLESTSKFLDWISRWESKQSAQRRFNKIVWAAEDKKKQRRCQYDQY